MSQKRTKRPNRKFLESDDSSEEMTMSSTQRRQSPRKKNRTLVAVPELPSLPTLPSPRKAPQTSVRKTISSSQSPQSNTMFDLCRSSNLGSSTALEKILVCVTEIKAQVHFNTQMLQTIAKKMDGISSASEEGEEETSNVDITFPIDSKEDLLLVDEKLQSKESRKKVVRSLSTIGGENVKLTVRRLLSHIISNKLAQEINWIGKGGKVAFSMLLLNTILKAVVRKNRICSGATDAEIATVAKDWFRFAKDRQGGRKQREERKKENGIEQATITQEELSMID
uniref:Uncharacterized protein LOC111116470 n=1 Tax=Crassostrea virginica TaxID=6565 RepID=A0A8B8C7T5_CRAVI|nr:uncharacterized protein LOC111116470 [Crassostrea virginica]